MGASEGNLLKRGKYYHWRFFLNGEQRSMSLKVKTLPEAKRVRAALMAEYDDNPASLLKRSANPELSEFWQAIEAHAATHKRKGTRGLDARAWNEFVAFCSQASRVGDIKRQDVEAFKGKLKREGARRKDGKASRPLSDATVNWYLRSLRATFNLGISLGLFAGENPLDNVKQYRTARTMPDFLTLEESDRLLSEAQAHSRQLYWVVLLGLYAGLRKNELVNARWDWFDFSERLIRVKRFPGAFEIKDHEERVIPMSKRIAEALEPFATDADGYLFDSGRDTEGRYQYRYEPKKAFATVADAAKVPRATFNLMRHTFGSQHAIAGTSIYKISKWMGHSSVDVTAKHYAGLQEYDNDIDRV